MMVFGQAKIFNSATKNGYKYVSTYNLNMYSDFKKADRELILENRPSEVRDYANKHNFIIIGMNTADAIIYGDHLEVVTKLVYIDQKDEYKWKAECEYPQGAITSDYHNYWKVRNYLSKYYSYKDDFIQSLVKKAYDDLLDACYFELRIQREKPKFEDYVAYKIKLLDKYPNDDVFMKTANRAYACIPNEWERYKEYIDVFGDKYNGAAVYERAYILAKNYKTLKAYNSYLRDFGKSHLIQTVYDDAFDLAKTKNSLYSYREYLNYFKASNHVAEVYTNAYNITKNDKNYGNYKTFLKDFKESSYVNTCHKEFYEYLLAKNSLEEYVSYASDFTNSQYHAKLHLPIYKCAKNTNNLNLLERSVDALNGSQYRANLIKEKNLEELSYNACNSEDTYHSYMIRYGEKSKHYSQAQTNYERLRAERIRREEEERRRREEEERRRREAQERREAEYEREREAKRNLGDCECSVGDRVYVIDEDHVRAETFFGYNVKFYGKVEQINSGRATIRISNYEILPGATYDYKNYNDTKKAKEYAAKYIGQTMEYNCSSYEIKKQ